MIAILAIVFFAAAVIEHGGEISVHTHWFDTTGLALLGFLCLALSGFTPPAVITRLHKRD